MGNVQLLLVLFYSQGPNMVTHQDDMTMDIFFRRVLGIPNQTFKMGPKTKQVTNGVKL